MKIRQAKKILLKNRGFRGVLGLMRQKSKHSIRSRVKAYCRWYDWHVKRPITKPEPFFYWL